VADYYLVTIERAGGWDWSKTRRHQVGWDEHAKFMDDLVGDGFVVLGGPVGDDEGDGQRVILVVDAEDDTAVRTRLADDPWMDDVLRIAIIEPWAVWLRAPED
jgi:hypothetical protein